MNQMERVWVRMKSTATKLAKREALINVTESKETVLHICSQEKLQPPSPEALHYLASELVRLTSEVVASRTLPRDNDLTVAGRHPAGETA